MAITKKQAQQLRGRITSLVHAEKTSEVAGIYDNPQELRDRAKRQRELLNEFIRSITEDD